MEQNQQSTSRRDRRYRRKKQSEWPHILLFYVLPFIVFNSILFFCLTTKPKLSVVVREHQRLPFHQRCPDRKVVLSD